MIEGRSLNGNLERLLGTMADLFAQEGRQVEVGVLATCRADSNFWTDFETGQDGYSIRMEIPSQLFSQLSEDRTAVEKRLAAQASQVAGVSQATIVLVQLLPALNDDAEWREKSKAWVAGQGVTNQGRVRSDNIAPRVCDGLLFRSLPEIHLYRALRKRGVSFAPLPVFVRGGETYRRIEPDFVILKDGIIVIVEVDGDTVHRETPLDAHNRTTMLVHEGAHVERVNAKECDTPEKAAECAAKILRVIEKLKTNK
jgi:hypothetical protein